MIQIYSTQGIFKGDVKLIGDDETVPSGYTKIPPIQPNYALIFEDGKWIETATEDEIAHWFDDGEEVKLEPSQEQLMINALGMQVAMLQAKLAGGENNV